MIGADISRLKKEGFLLKKGRTNEFRMFLNRDDLRFSTNLYITDDNNII